VSVAVTLGIAELVTGLLSDGRSLVIAVGDTVIDLVPGWLERAVISTVGANDKPFLIANVLVVSGLLGAVLGVLSARRFLLGAAGLATMTGVGVAASLADPQAGGAGSVAAGLVGGCAGILTLWLLMGLLTGPLTGPARSSPVQAPAPAVRDPGGGGVADRKRFLVVAAAAVVVAGAGGLGGRVLAGRKRIDEIRQAIRIPRPARRAPAPPAGAELGIAGLAPLYVPNDEFYRIDTALLVPQVDPGDWSLEVKGMVDRPFELTYAELLAMPHTEADVTLSCVSNEVGGAWSATLAGRACSWLTS